MQQLNQDVFIRVDEVMHYIWDPIGVSGIPEARDEYTSYAAHVFSLLGKNAPREEIIAYLDNITVNHIGLQPNSKHSARIADILLKWMKFYTEKTSSFGKN